MTALHSYLFRASGICIASSTKPGPDHAGLELAVCKGKFVYCFLHQLSPLEESECVYVTCGYSVYLELSMRA